MRVFILVLFLLMAAPAYADCTPSNDLVGPHMRSSWAQGGLVYDLTNDVLKTCDGTNWSVVTGGGDTSMVPGWPDAIKCTVTGGAFGAGFQFIYYLNLPPYNDGKYYYRGITNGSGSDAFVGFNADGSHYVTTNFTTSDCSVSIASLYAQGRAFKFIGSSGGGAAPAGMVAAFDLAVCPNGWTAYAASSGRFLRGRCLSGEPCNDPDGARSAGSVQADELKSHSHNLGAYQRHYGSISPILFPSGSTAGPDNTIATSGTGGAETRPKNVAVLYCRKD